MTSLASKIGDRLELGGKFHIWHIFAIALLVHLLLKGYTAVNPKSPKKHEVIPTVGFLPAWAPSFLHNIAFAGYAAKLLHIGYNGFKHEPFRYVRDRTDAIVLPLTLLAELAALPSTIASSHDAIAQDLLGSYTGLNSIVESRLHHQVIHKRLNPSLHKLAPALEQELGIVLHEHLGHVGQSEWSSFNPYHVMGMVSARLSSYIMVGPALSNSDWIELSLKFTESVSKTVIIMRSFPHFLHPLICWFVPSFWECHRFLQLGQQILGPKIRQLLYEHDNHSWKPSGSPEDSSLLCWFVEMARGQDRTPQTLARLEVCVTLAAVHTTLLRMVNVLYDITSSEPELSDKLASEIVCLKDEFPGWPPHVYDRLHLLDSVFRESQRMSPSTIIGMKRIFKTAHTFSNGLHIPKGTYACFPTLCIENDPDLIRNPDTFDGQRSYREYRQRQQQEPDRDHSAEFRFSSPGPMALGFGLGRAACPGRFFATMILKMMFVRLITEYEFQFPPGHRRPERLSAYEFTFYKPDQEMWIRKREVHVKE
ncbi:cytochrome P450 [Xylariaceae sp. FL1019]|nr:cytochrome P450 [Xylariaceae sp. FL1019]